LRSPNSHHFLNLSIPSLFRFSLRPLYPERSRRVCPERSRRACPERSRSVRLHGESRFFRAAHQI